MKKTIKKITASVMALATMAVSAVSINAGAASFETQHVHVPGDGNSYSSEATFDYRTTIKIVCTSVYTSNGSTYGCETRVKCLNNGNDMTPFVTTGTYYRTVSGMSYVPSITYRLTAYTSVNNNKYRTSGSFNPA